MPLSRRYTPEHPPGESCLFGLDFSALIPPGIGIMSGALLIQINSNPPQTAPGFTASAVQVRDRVLYATLSGGIAGTDYLLTWTATDTEGNIWPRTAAVLCAPTS